MTPVRLFTPKRFGDERGWFSEVYKESELLAAGIDIRFVQDNHSLSRPAFTLRGLHFQTPPHAQVKLVRCIRGSIFDVAVDLRRGSPSYGRWAGCILSAESGAQLFIAAGFAHGFLTLEPDCEITYKVSAAYAPSHDTGLRWDDPEIAIDWPLPADQKPLLSVKDQHLPSLRDFDSPFAYDGHPLEPILSCAS